MSCQLENITKWDNLNGDYMIGTVIKYIRKQKKYKQEVLGEMINVKGNTITQYEKGQRNPTFETIEKIANICDYTIYFKNNTTGETFTTKDLDRKDI